VEQLYKETEAAQLDFEKAQDRLDDIMAKITELEKIKGRHAEMLVLDSRAHEVNSYLHKRNSKQNCLNLNNINKTCIGNPSRNQR
jgi:hypothetical protein